MDRAADNVVRVVQADRSILRTENRREVVRSSSDAAPVSRSESDRIVVRDVVQTNYITRGSPGPIGPSGTATVSVPPIEFSYGDAPSLRWTAPVNGTFLNTRIEIGTPFNGSVSTIKVGIIGNVEALMRADQNNPSESAVYDAASDFAVVAGTGIWLEVTPGAGTNAGAGTLYVEFLPES